MTLRQWYYLTYLAVQNTRSYRDARQCGHDEPVVPDCLECAFERGRREGHRQAGAYLPDVVGSIKQVALCQKEDGDGCEE